MGLPLNESPPSNPPPPAATDRIEAGIAAVFVGQNGIRAGWRWLIFLLICFVCARFLILAAAAAGILHINKGQSSQPVFNVSSVAMQEGALVIGLFVAAFIMSRIERREMGEYGLPRAEAFGRKFWQGVVWGLMAMTLTLLLIAALHGFTFGSVSLSGPALAKYALVWAVAFLLTGFFEEFLFRGYSLFTLSQGMHFWPAAIFLSLLFGAGHLSNAGEAWPGALSAGLIGFFFCFTVRRTGSIWFAVGLHAAWDYGETFVYGVPDSGFLAPGHLLNSSFHGPRWLTGGQVGPEASIFCFVVVALMFLVFHLAYPPRKEGSLTP
jgi:CAAX protease family protein